MKSIDSQVVHFESMLKSTFGTLSHKFPSLFPPYIALHSLSVTHNCVSYCITLHEVVYNCVADGIRILITAQNLHSFLGRSLRLTSWYPQHAHPLLQMPQATIHLLTLFRTIN
jgi:hypothetical protein